MSTTGLSRFCKRPEKLCSVPQCTSDNVNKKKIGKFAKKLNIGKAITSI